VQISAASAKIADFPIINQTSREVKVYFLKMLENVLALLFFMAYNLIYGRFAPEESRKEWSFL